MKTFKLKNGVEIYQCLPLNWRVEKTYAIDIPNNPKFLIINVGSIADMWQATLIPETMILSFCSVHYSNNEIYRFKVDSIEEASKWVLKFAEGMNCLEDLKETIYWKHIF